MANPKPPPLPKRPTSNGHKKGTTGTKPGGPGAPPKRP